MATLRRVLIPPDLDDAPRPTCTAMKRTGQCRNRAVVVEPEPRCAEHQYRERLQAKEQQWYTRFLDEQRKELGMKSTQSVPVGKRTPRRFKATEETTYRDLQSTMRKIGATGLRVSADFDTGEHTIQFDRTGRRYVFRCNRWPHPVDNLRATQRTISLLVSALEEYGTVTSFTDETGARKQTDPFAQFFLPFEATPDDSVLLLGSGQWYDILGVPENASKAEITNAYKVLTWKHHPDHPGGSTEAFTRLQEAFYRGLAHIEGPSRVTLREGT